MNLQNDPTKELIIRYEKPIQKVVDEKFKNERTQEEVLKEILIETYENGPNSSVDLQTLLNIMIPPIEFEDSNKQYISYVSNKASNWEEIIELKRILECKLREQQAKSSGVCPVWQQLFFQCFDEVLRQVTIECPQWGLLLMRVWDEMRMTLDAYKTLYKGADSFGIQQQLESQKNKNELKQELEELNEEKNKLLMEIDLLQTEQQVFQENFEDKMSNLRKQWKQEIDFLENQNNQLKQLFQTLELDG